MSGIVGLFYLDGRSVQPETLGRMIDILAHRGPDGADIWCEGPVGLGHRMLHTTPESLTEQLPLVKGAGSLGITADARIDNREELIPLLGFDDRPAIEVADSELILAAYERWGEACVDHLLGAFVFVIWDAREHKLFCARDHFGVKPFYYFTNKKVFVFASEIKALFCLPEIPKRVDELRIAAQLTDLLNNKVRTFYEGIKRLPPASHLTLRVNSKKLGTYWSLDPTFEHPQKTDEEYAAEFLDIFQKAISCRLRSAFPLGSLLSGGLDSSSITCAARELLPATQSLSTFSLIFNRIKECDEQEYINEVLKDRDLQPTFLHGDEVGPLNDLNRVLWHLDSPIYGGNLFLNWLLQEAVEKKGVRVLLDGFDGDTTVSHGTGYLMELARDGHWLRLAREAGGYARHFDHRPHEVIWFWLWRYGLHPRLQQSSSLDILRRIKQRFSKSAATPDIPEKFPVLNPQFIAETDLNALQLEKSPPPQTQREAHFYRITWGILTHMLETHNSTAAAFGVENRYPFWDKRLVEFCLALPPNQKLHNGWNRTVMRRAMEGTLPEMVRWRGGKADLSANFEHGLLTYDQERIDRVLVNNGDNLNPYINMSYVHKIYDQFLMHDLAREKVTDIWRPVSLALWLQQVEIQN